MKGLVAQKRIDFVINTFIISLKENKIGHIYETRYLFFITDLISE